MANLLPRTQAPFAALTDEQRVRALARARFVVSAWETLRAAGAEVAARLESELDDLDEAPALASAQAILAEIDVWRSEIDVESDDGGTPDSPPAEVRWLLYRPGRSLRSGEAEVASRGLIDVADRPPPGLWLEAIARPRAEGSEQTEVGILCAVPEAAEGAVGKAVRACASGALAWLDGVDGALVVRAEAP